MTTIAIEISDVGLIAVGDSGILGPPSPGYALLERRRVVTGEQALRAARLKPRFVSHRHWDRLSQQPVGRPFPRRSTHADLVHAHLSTFWAEVVALLQQPSVGVSVLLAVPGSYSHEQLGLLLGIARACDIPVAGLVDAALASLGGSVLATSMSRQTLLHLDIHLHHALWSVIEPRAAELGQRPARTRIEALEEVGLLQLQRRWLQFVADRFVRQTRFDPLHDGASEQDLFDRLPGWIHEIDTAGSAILSLDSGARARGVEVTASQLAAATQGELDILVAAAARLRGEAGDGVVVLSSRAARIPGLVASLAQLAGSDAVLLPQGAAAIGALAHREQIESPGDQLQLVLELSVQEHHG